MISYTSQIQKEGSVLTDPESAIERRGLFVKMPISSCRIHHRLGGIAKLLCNQRKHPLRQVVLLSSQFLTSTSGLLVCCFVTALSTDNPYHQDILYLCCACHLNINTCFWLLVHTFSNLNVKSSTVLDLTVILIYLLNDKNKVCHRRET